MESFLKFFDEKKDTYAMHLEVYYSKTMDWCISIYRKGCAEDGSDLYICDIQHPDMEYVFAKAHVELKDFLMEHEGGY